MVVDLHSATVAQESEQVDNRSKACREANRYATGDRDEVGTRL